MTKPGHRVTLAVAASIALICVSSPAFAGPPEDPSSHAGEVLASIGSTAPEVLEDRVSVDSSAFARSVPDSSGERVVVQGKDKSFRVGLPFSEVDARVTLHNDTAVFDNENASSTVPIIKQDGSVQIVTVIENSTAPTEYRYDLAVPAGGSAEIIDGYIVVRDANGSFVAGALPAWAEDAAGAQVPTHYELDGNTLTQVVQHVGYAYPVVADPWFGINLFSAIGKTTQNGLPRYHLYRSAWGVAVSTGTAAGGGIATVAAGQLVMLGAGWDEAKNLHSGLLAKATLHQQYDCHVYYAAFKPDSWNLEQFRSNYSGWGSNALSHQCNW